MCRIEGRQDFAGLSKEGEKTRKNQCWSGIIFSDTIPIAYGFLDGILSWIPFGSKYHARIIKLE